MTRTKKHQRPAAQPRPARALPWRWLLVVAGVAALVVFIQARNRTPTPASALPGSTPAQAAYGYDIVHTYPHDRGAFTQGLVFRDGFLYESTGLQGQSTLRKVEIETGRVVRQVPVAPEHFAEGLAEYGNRLIQLTWQSQRGLVYDLDTFSQTGTFEYAGEGWGLARDGSRLVMSDGSATLRFLDAETLKETGRLNVMEGSRPLADLNELEIVKGDIYANVWQTDSIVIISPKTGQVTGRVNLRGLLTASDLTQQVDVMNGIAYDSAGDRLFVTGKWWPKLFEIRLRHN